MENKVIEEIAKLDFINGVTRMASYSDLFKNVTEGLDTETKLILAKEYLHSRDIVSTTESLIPKMVILQLRKSNETSPLRFESYETLRDAGEEPNIDNYEIVYIKQMEQPLSTNMHGQILSQEYQRLNDGTPRPSNYYGHALSMGDVAVLMESDIQMKAYYVDAIGYREMPRFLNDKVKSKIVINMDVKIEHDLLKDIRAFGMKQTGDNILPTILIDRFNQIQFDYTTIFELADKKTVLEQQDKLNSIFDFELLYGGESLADSITYYDNDLGRVTIKEDILQANTGESLQTLVDETYQKAQKDKVEHFDSCNDIDDDLHIANVYGEDSAQAQADIALDYREYGAEQNQLNHDCLNFIANTLNDNYNGITYPAEMISNIIKEQYGTERPMAVLAQTIQRRPQDGRISPSVRERANLFINENINAGLVTDDIHSCQLNELYKAFMRNELKEQATQKPHVVSKSR